MSRALLLLGHGSHLNPDSARPIYDHADRIRETDRYDEVRVAFWKEEPSLREVLRTIESEEVVAVPLLMSDGYFAGRVFPRELGLEDPSVAARVAYADPVGTHDAMTDVIEQRAKTVTDDPTVGPGVGLAVVGHGTERSEKSARSTEYHAEQVRKTGRFEEVKALFLDESPFVEDVTDHFGTDEVVVVPLFVSDGYHTTEDIPEELGLADDTGYETSAVVDGTRLFYAGAVGTEPTLTEVVVERAVEAESAFDEHDPRPSPTAADAREAFTRWLARVDARTWGQLLVRSRESGYELRHRDDRNADPGSLERHTDPVAVRDLARFDDDGRYRPLPGAPTLPTGWRLETTDEEELVRAVEYVYPASVENWHLERTGDLEVTPYAETAARQTGIYAGVEEFSGEALDCGAAAVCGDCVKRRVWDERDERTVDAERGEGAIPCREACSLFVAATREFLNVESGDHDHEPSHDGDDPRPGAVEDPANRYRRRYARARRERHDLETIETGETPCTREQYTS